MPAPTAPALPPRPAAPPPSADAPTPEHPHQGPPGPPHLGPPHQGPPPAPPAPAAERRVVLAALALGAAAAVLLPGGPPGAGAVVLAALGVVAVVLVRRGGPRPTGWQLVHAALAVLLVIPAALLDAAWVVRIDLLTALVLASVALAPHRTGAGLLAAPPRLLGRLPSAGAQLVRGVAGPSGVGRGLGPVARGALITAVLLAVFVPLLASADPRFADVLLAVTRLRDAHPVGAATAFAVTAVAATAGLQLLRRPPPDLHLPPPAAVLRRTSEWLLPLGALDLLLAAFVAVRTRELAGSDGDRAQLVHEGFFQLVAVTGLVLVVVVAALRWTAAGPGVRAALGVLCALALLVDAAALQQLLAYTAEMGWTRLRVGVAVVCLGLAALLLVLLAAGSPGLRRARGAGSTRWAPHAVVLVAGLCVVGLTAADPDARVAVSQVERGREADLAYLASLSADAVPAITALSAERRGCVLGAMDPTGSRWAGAGWTSANASRARARAVLDGEDDRTCPTSALAAASR